jgi:hypothetical protein
MSTPKKIPARSVFPARVAVRTVAEYVSVNKNADSKILPLINERLSLNNSAT